MSRRKEMTEEIQNLKKQLAWFNDFADCVQGNHRVYDIACEYAEEQEVEREGVCDMDEETD